MAIVAVVSAKGTAGVLALRQAASTGFLPGLEAPVDQEKRNAIAEARVVGLAIDAPSSGDVQPAPSAIAASFPAIPNLADLVNA